MNTIRIVCLALALVAALDAAAESVDEGGEQVQWANDLAGSGSPYLEQHAENPVHWQRWSEEVFRRAEEADKPVLISIGYSTCHWCHVMAHESFEDETVAEVMNRYLVSVKVDREQHPGVDSVYMEAAGALIGSAGWPLNVFADHEGRPFLAVTYLPPQRWMRLVTEVNRVWNDDREKIRETAAAVTEHLTERQFPPDADPSALPAGLMESLRQSYDTENPGFGRPDSPMKFPPSQSIDWLLEHGGEDGRRMAFETLRAMMDSGLHDRVGGGFHRYSVSADWRVPHFEKMTYDNAQLMGLYARASSLAADEDFSDDLLRAARGISDWFLREMRIESRSGNLLGYATATDADDDLGEGSFFAWPPAEVEEVLGAEDASWLIRRWHLSGDGRLPAPGEGHDYEPRAAWIPHPRGRAGYSESASRGRPDADREQDLAEKLRVARMRRAAPLRDDKILTDQNALLLEGFTRLARYGGGEKYRRAAEELADRLVVLNTDGSPRRARVQRSEGIRPYITDYGYLAMALTGAYALLGKVSYVFAAEAVAEAAVERMAVGEGSYFSTELDARLFKRPVEEFDGPSPAGQYALGVAFNRLYAITGDGLWKSRTEALLSARAAVAKYAPTAASTLVRVASMYSEPYSLVIAGPADDSRTARLADLVRRRTGPDLIVIPADLAAAEAGESWAELKMRIGLSDPQLLVCREGSCLLPAFTEEDAIDRLEEIGEGE